MKNEIRNVMTLAATAAFTLVLATSGVWANEPGYGKDGHSGGEHGVGRGHGMGMMHNSAGHLIRHLLKHEKEIGLTADQVTKLKEIQLNLDKTRIKTEADIQVAEREIRALTDNEKSDLGAIESKLKQSEDLQVALRMTSIKTRREVLAMLTPEQRQKEQAEHEKMMQQHKEGGKDGKNPHGGGMGNPHGGTMPGQPPKAADAPPVN